MKNDVVFLKFVYEVDLVFDVVVLECFWMSDIYIEVDMDFMFNFRGS